MIFFLNFKNCGDKEAAGFFSRSHRVPVGGFHIDTIVVERKNRKVSEPAKKKSRENISSSQRE